MTLTTHAIVGAAAAVAVDAFAPTPAGLALGLVAGFASHLAIDALPHWDHGSLLRSTRIDPSNPLNFDMEIGKDFFFDLLFLGVDALLGLLLSIFLFSLWLMHVPFVVIFVGVVGGLLPDALQFVYMKTRTSLLLPLQRFHIWLQRLDNFSALPGLAAEFALVVAVVSLLKFFF